MSGMRHRLIHASFGIGYSLGWFTVKNRLQSAKKVIKERVAMKS
jgi:uncharacterized protein with HEPN domain